MNDKQTNKTPVQLLEAELNLALSMSADIDAPLTRSVMIEIKKYLVLLLEYEKQFARDCFDAGMKYSVGSHKDLKQIYPDFDNFYKLYEQ